MAIVKWHTFGKCKTISTFITKSIILLYYFVWAFFINEGLPTKVSDFLINFASLYPYYKKYYILHWYYFSIYDQLLFCKHFPKMSRKNCKLLSWVCGFNSHLGKWNVSNLHFFDLVRSQSAALCSAT